MIEIRCPAKGRCFVLGEVHLERVDPAALAKIHAQPLAGLIRSRAPEGSDVFIECVFGRETLAGGGSLRAPPLAGCGKMPKMAKNGR